MAPPESKQQLPISNRNNTKKKVLAILLPALLAVAIGFFLQSEHGDGLLPGASWAMQVHKTRHAAHVSAPAPATPAAQVPAPAPAKAEPPQAADLGSPLANSPLSSLPPPPPGSVCHLQGSVDECCNCSYAAATQLNEQLYPVLRELVRTPFFRFFKVNLWCDCPLWPDDSMCMLRACSVCECDPHEVPKPWLDAEKGLTSGPSCSSAGGHNEDSQSSSSAEAKRKEGCDSALCAAEAEGTVDRGMSPEEAATLAHLPGWRGHNNPWMAEGDDDESYTYVNLLKNPERYTGYAGEHAHRVWSTIYNQSCLKQADQCTGKRVLYRLISGMHASISMHIAANYLIDEQAGVWGPSTEQFMARLGLPEHRGRVENLYFAYLFVLRAVQRASDLLSRFQYTTGSSVGDAETARLIQQLLGREELVGSCPMPFDEGRMWKGGEGPALIAELQDAFRNITRVMDCVGCEKCRLWGKLQTLGLASALKVLFSQTDCGSAGNPASPSLSLERNEVIALVNLLERFSASLHYYRTMSAMVAGRAGWDAGSGTTFTSSATTGQGYMGVQGTIS